MTNRILFHYRTRAGTFWIMPQTGSPGRYWLGIDDDGPLGSYVSPQLAAGDVYTHTTGHDEWDSLDGRVDGPADLSEWERGDQTRLALDWLSTMCQL